MKISPREVGTLEVPLRAGSMDLGSIELRVIVTGTPPEDLALLRAEATAVAEEFLDRAADAFDAEDYELEEQLSSVANIIDRLLWELP